MKDPGFRVRRYEQRLVVTHVHSDSSIKRGTSFLSLGGYSVEELRQKHSRLLQENHAERENWLPILLKYSFGEVMEQEGNLSTVQFKQVERREYKASYNLEVLSNDSIKLTFTDFMNPDAMMKLVLENQELLQQTENWIIDVRENCGGSDSSFYPLLPFLMPKEGVELRDTEDKMLYHCTINNAKRALRELEDDIKQIEDEQALMFLKAYKDQWEKHQGNEFVEFNFDTFLPDTFVKGTDYPKKVVILTDSGCASSGESFVELCKKSNKVTVLGRPTMGVNDYANLVTQEWQEGFELMYASSRLSRIDQGLGMTGKGIEPNVYVPWTPEHVERDVDLQKAVEYLRKEAGK